MPQSASSKAEDGTKKKPAKQFVAHGRHSRNLSSTRLSAAAGRSKQFTIDGGVAGGEDQDQRGKMKRSKSSDSILSKKDKRMAPLKSIKSHTKLQTRPSPTHAPNSTSQVPRNNAVIQLDHESDTDDDEDDADDGDHEKEDKQDRPDVIMERSNEGTPLTSSPKDDYHSEGLARVKEDNRPILAKSSSQDSLPPSYIKHKAALPPRINNEIVFATTQEGGIEASPQQQQQQQQQSSPQKQSQQNGRPSLDRTMSATHTTRTQQKLWLQRESAGQQQPSPMSPEQRKEFERISKEYISVCRYSQPLTESVTRVLSHRLKQKPSNIPKRQTNSKSDLAMGLSQSLPKRINSLSAAILNSDTSIDSQHSNIWYHDPSQYSSTSTEVDTVSQNLSQLWNSEWKDPDEVGTTPSSYEQPPSINSQAQNAHQHMSQARAQRGPNGGIRLG